MSFELQTRIKGAKVIPLQRSIFYDHIELELAEQSRQRQTIVYPDTRGILHKAEEVIRIPKQEPKWNSRLKKMEYV